MKALCRWPNRIASFVVLVLLFPLPSIGQTVKADALLDTSRMLIGDQVNLWLTLEQPVGWNIRFPVVVDSLDQKIEVLSVSPIDTMDQNGELINLRQRLLLTVFDTGLFVIPPLPFKLDEGDKLFTTRALPLEVLGMPVDTTKGIVDIKPLYDMPVSFAEVLPFILIGFLIAAILFFYFRYLKKRRHKPLVNTEPEIPPIPAHIWALEQLDNLIKEKLWQQKKVKLFYSRLTDIIRQYIEMRFKVPAMEQTTDEILRAFDRNRLINGIVKTELKELLEIADLVKFAKWHPVTEEHEHAQQWAYDFILRTKPSIDLRKPVDENTLTEEKEVKK